MIARIQGVLESIEGNVVLLQLPAGLTYQVLVPAYTAARLAGSLGQSITLHTYHFVESQGQGTTLIPRLAGFVQPEDQRFYELFTTCKGIGNKRALRAMALSTAQIAGAIADRDLALLQSLPEIGKRTAETIVATLSGKVDAFLTIPAGTGVVPDVDGVAASPPAGSLGRDALEALVALGENRTQAMAWIDQALRSKDRPATVADLVQRVYRIKSGGT